MKGVAEAMRILRARGLKFIWLNIGSVANKDWVSQLKQKRQEYGLEQEFVLLGAQDNPYPYMSKAKAVCLFSDYESWPLSIAEAKRLGKVVLATKTSGASEHITYGVDGLLCDFTAEAVANTIERFLTDADLQTSLRANVRFEDNAAFEQFESLVWH